jgi:lipoate-protein ligase A
LHLHDLTYAFFYPAACEPRLRAIDLRVRFRHAFLEAFAALGVEAEASHGQTWRMPDSAVCFHGQAEHEILIAGRKVAGNAQRVSRRGIFQHGSILFENTEELFCRLVRPARWTGTVTGLREHVPGATPDALAPLLAHTVARAFDLDPVPVAPAAFG